ncbi:MAG: hypothetical protein QGI68_12020 [Pseudomonadales bacterium]|jgi:hypothetical protein|nr:hypothetical protein [Pseudomonadales bacterium]MDP7596278.1 hypothetical protein [Pseudomonadales bacterium]HJN52003.1 hypothetical protein [Pseudomonadales bacterium]|tara:strand:+ start:994 stop:1458 length:465 start_codon:yes stop_codon:yes gene_type:complete
MQFRSPRDGDWSTILTIANRSVFDVPGAGEQDQWLSNRRSFSKRGFQHHFVLADDHNVFGYGAVEHATDAPPDSYRIFVVTYPEHLQDYGAGIYEYAERKLIELGAANARFVEYAEDHRLNSFILARGYAEIGRFQLDSGQEAVVLSKDYSSRR